MDLMGGYLLVILILFSIDFALLAGNIKLSNFKVIIFSLIVSIISFALIMIPQSFNHSDFLLNNFDYLFLISAVIIFSVMFFYIRKNNLRTTFYIIIALFFILTVCLAYQSKLMLVDSLLYSLLVFIFLFVVYQLTRLLVHAKRPYPIIVGEYMSLFSILMLIFAFTYDSTINLDYGMFKPFLILTPTFQLIYLVVGICIVMVIGVLLNDTKGGN